MDRMLTTNVLVIEDNKPDQYLIKEMLKATNIPIENIYFTETLQKGLDFLEENSIDLLFVDLSLPDSDGIETVKVFLEKYYNTPIIVLTGLDDISIGLEALHLGAEDYMVKGTLDPYILERAILYALQRNENKKQMSKTMDILQSYNQKLEQFAQIISHDLMSPIVSIKSVIQLYELEKKHGEITQSAEEAMKEVHKGVDKLHNRLKSLIKTLVEQKSTGSQFENIELYPFVSKVVNDVKNMYDKEDLEVNIDIDSEQTLPFVPELFYSVMQNLLSNAIKYRAHNREPRIQVSAIPDKEFWIIKVSDNGIGIDLSKNKHRMFGMFQRFNEDVEGKGIGLHLVRNIIHSNGGKIEVESQVDQGTTFNLYLPRDRKF